MSTVGSSRKILFAGSNTLGKLICILVNSSRYRGNGSKDQHVNDFPNTGVSKLCHKSLPILKYAFPIFSEKKFKETQTQCLL